MVRCRRSRRSSGVGPPESAGVRRYVGRHGRPRARRPPDAGRPREDLPRAALRGHQDGDPPPAAGERRGVSVAGADGGGARPAPRRPRRRLRPWDCPRCAPSPRVPRRGCPRSGCRGQLRRDLDAPGFGGGDHPGGQRRGREDRTCEDARTRPRRRRAAQEVGRDRRRHRPREQDRHHHRTAELTEVRPGDAGYEADGRDPRGDGGPSQGARGARVLQPCDAAAAQRDRRRGEGRGRGGPPWRADRVILTRGGTRAAAQADVRLAEPVVHPGRGRPRDQPAVRVELTSPARSPPPTSRPTPPPVTGARAIPSSTRSDSSSIVRAGSLPARVRIGWPVTSRRCTRGSRIASGRVASDRGDGVLHGLRCAELPRSGLPPFDAGRRVGRWGCRVWRSGPGAGRSGGRRLGLRALGRGASCISSWSRRGRGGRGSSIRAGAFGRGAGWRARPRSPVPPRGCPSSRAPRFGEAGRSRRRPGRRDHHGRRRPSPARSARPRGSATVGRAAQARRRRRCR